MDDKAYIVLIDSHTKGVGRANDRSCPFDEIFLDPFFQGRVETGMKGFRRIPGQLEKFCQILRVFSGRAINDDTACAMVSRPEQFQNRLILFMFFYGPHLVMQIGAFVQIDAAASRVHSGEYR